jgi:hypothetical protein
MSEARSTYTLRERVSLKSLRLLASCPAADAWRPAGAVSLRTIITDIILCTEDVEDSTDEGMLTSLA